MRSFSILCLVGIFIGCGGSSDLDHSPPLSPEEALATFELKPGYQIELVAAEPLVEDPILIQFDEAGRMWVVEMRGFMNDIDGTGEDEPTGRVSILWDDDNDGVMDRRTTFQDSLVMPRALAIVKGGALIAENKPLWFFEDTDGDLIADKKTLIDAEYGGSGLPEHSANGLLRGMDNWFYNAKSRARYKRVGDSWIKDETEFRGQWGIAQDDWGRLYYNYNWSQLHADLVPPNYLSRNPNHKPTSGLDIGLTVNRSVYPIRPTRAVNRGYIPGNLDAEGKIMEFTSASAPLVYRGNAMQDLQGDVFVCEPAGNLIKRNIVKAEDFSLTAEFAYPDSEFLASTDERFRPVSLAAGPDGALYIVDMYRGLVQHGAYITPYLREETLKRDLVLPIHMGRIWRIVPDNWQAPGLPDLSSAAASTLQKALFSRDGWLRDTAQRLLVEADDLSIAEKLANDAKVGNNPRGRLQALWTLEGLNHKSPEPFFTALEDPDPAVQAAGFRILEQKAMSNSQIRKRLISAMHDCWEDAPAEVALQIALTAGSLPIEDKIPLLSYMADRFVDEPIMRDAILSGLENHEFGLLNTIWGQASWQTEEANRSIFLEMLTAAITRNGEPGEIANLAQKADQASANDNWRAKALRNSLVLYNAQESTTDAQSGEPVDAETLELIAQGRQQYLTSCAGCHGTDGAGLARFAPPLVESEWVLGSEEVLTRLVIHGMEGPVEVNGQLYDAPDILPVMPGHSALDDAELAAVLTYIRKAWGHNAAPIVRRTVGRIRHGSQGRVVPWTAEELIELDVPSSSP